MFWGNPDVKFSAPWCPYSVQNSLPRALKSSHTNTQNRSGAAFLANDSPWPRARGKILPGWEGHSPSLGQKDTKEGEAWVVPMPKLETCIQGWEVTDGLKNLNPASSSNCLWTGPFAVSARVPLLLGVERLKGDRQRLGAPSLQEFLSCSCQ